MATGKSRHLCIAEKLGLSSIEASARLSQHRSQRRVVSMILDWVPLMIVSTLMEAFRQVSLKQRGLHFEKPESASTYKLSFQFVHGKCEGCLTCQTNTRP
jgi:hypothetical protein